jgi:hypothetical protein
MHQCKHDTAKHTNCKRHSHCKTAQQEGRVKIHNMMMGPVAAHETQCGSDDSHNQDACAMPNPCTYRMPLTLTALPHKCTAGSLHLHPPTHVLHATHLATHVLLLLHAGRHQHICDLLGDTASCMVIHKLTNSALVCPTTKGTSGRRLQTQPFSIHL